MNKTATWVKVWAVAASLVANSALAEPTSNPVQISELRPYVGGSVVFVYATTLLCSQSFYSIDLSTSAGKAAFAVALTAVTTGRAVKIEIASVQCGTGPAGSTIIQSLYLAN